MRLAWLTDVHLDFLSDAAVAALGVRVARDAPDAALLTGDISIAPELARDLGGLVSSWSFPCYFVAGNHDYYGASIAAVRRGLRELRNVQPRLRWLPAEGVVPLTETTALVGVDGWGDGRLGDPEGTPVLFNDHLRIEELIAPDRAALLDVVRALGDREAESLREVLEPALARYAHVYVATHVPPFAAAARHRGQPSGAQWLPWMTCHAVGEALRSIAAAHPDRRITVLAGHTHDRARLTIAPNLEVRTGAAEYGAPAIEALLEIE